ncbi:COP1-interacting protein 7 [Euphorbia lathyris]|uniref:COP1-interacting protein 7 n=1 Tax=Euphorbia lathyris TaxID=212925 RepID=UPI003313F2FF
MDSRTLLDHALFQLTPTRTRCDLVIFGGGVSEKLASGLLQPFLSHLKTAQDQILKGGYSISLRPLPTNVYWFTKATLQRFVRFVGSPEVLERFVTIEKELEQIESSVQSNESADAEGASGSYQKSGTSDVLQGDNSKARLQRALETRKAVLRKEQAMAYARALVTGFEMDSISDLISFADAFGASRLREACLNFMELCKKKNQDRLWMEEIAAMQASRLELPYLGTSGVVLAGEENYGSQINGLSAGKLNGSIDASDSSHGSLELNQDSGLTTPAHVQSMDGRAPVPMPWPNNHPQYMHNFQGPMYQQMQPYQGYLYPGMQFPPPYVPGNMQWPPKVDDWEPEDRKKHKSSSRNKKSSRGKGQEASIEDNSADPSDSSSETESDEIFQNGAKESSEPIHRKKNGKKSSRKVVIRNINYITSKRNGGKESTSNETSDGEEFIGEAIKQQVEEAVGSLGRQHKSTSRHHKKSHRSTIDDSNDEDKKEASSNREGHKGNDAWGSFQNILLQDKDLDSFDSEPRPLQLQEYSEMGMSSAVNLESEQIRNQRAISNDSFLAAKRETSSETEFHLGSFEAGENLSPLTMKTDSTYEELLFSQRNEESKSRPQPTFSDHSTESLMIKSQKEEDWFISNQQDKSVNKDGSTSLGTFDGDYASSLAGDHIYYEESKKTLPVDDSFFINNRSLADDQSEPILRRDISMDADIVEATEYENGNQEKSNDKSEAFGSHEPDDLYMVLGRDSAAENVISSWTMDYENDPLSAEANETYVPEDKPPSNVKPTNAKTGPGGKIAGKETKSKVSNGTSGRSKTDLTSKTKKPTPAGKHTVPRSKNKEEETRRRLEELSIQRQKRIAERSTAGNGAAASKRLPVKKMSTVSSAKTEDPKIQSPSQVTKKTVCRTSTIERLASARAAPKVESVQSKAIQPKKPTSKTNGPSQKTNASEQKRPSSNTVKPDVPQKKESKVVTAEKPMQVPATKAPQPQPTNDIDEFKDIKELHSISSAEKNEINELSERESKEVNSSFHIDSSTQHDHLKGKDEEVTIEAPMLHEDMKTTEMSIHPMPEVPNKDLDISAENAREISVQSEYRPWPETSEIQVSTTPPDEIIPEPVHSRKKWNSDETSPKAAKGFRKLLLFGRKSRTSTNVMA